MNDYEITIHTDSGFARIVIQADNYETATIVADQMNQGYISVDEVSYVN